MKRIALLIAAGLMLAAAAGAQESPANGTKPKPATTDTTTPAPAAKPAISLAPAIEIQYVRPNDKRGLHVFETAKEAGAPYQ